MAIKFLCPNCNHVIVTKYLNPGDLADCKNCRIKSKVLEDSENISTEEFDSLRNDTVNNMKQQHDEMLHNKNIHLEYLASRWKRLLGHLVDYWLILIPMTFILYPAFIKYASLADSKIKLLELTMESTYGFFAIIYLIIITIIQSIILLKKSQTIGKLIFGTRVVNMENNKPEWWRLLFIRPLITVLVSYRPTVQWTDQSWGVTIEYILKFIGFIDAIMIFGDEKRTLRDYMADTKVIDLKKYNKYLDNINSNPDPTN